METLKKIGLKLLYPHVAIIITLLPISLTLMIWSMVVLGEAHFVTIIGYVLSAYVLTTICFRIPDIIKLVKYIKKFIIHLFKCIFIFKYIRLIMNYFINSFIKLNKF